MGRIEKTVFISYRRANKPWALFVYQNLTNHGYDVFIDFQNINSGNFESAILDNISARAHFVVVLTPSALEDCKNPGDWLRREIEFAMDEKRNIVPLMVEGFDFGSSLVKKALTGKLSILSDINGLHIPDDYPFEAMDRLRERFLNIALSDVFLPVLHPKAREIANAEKSAANKAPPVKEDQLTAQTWYESGYVFQDENNFDEAIRCFTEAIQLEPKLDRAYFWRAFAFFKIGEVDRAITDYDSAIDIQPDPLYYSGRGNAYINKKLFKNAITDFNKAIHLNSEFNLAYYFRGDAFFEIDNIDSAIADYTEAIRLEPELGSVYWSRARAWEKTREYSKAIEDFQKHLELGGGVQERHQKYTVKRIRALKRKLTFNALKRILTKNKSTKNSQNQI